MSISSIDELLMGGGGNSQQPDSPEYQETPEAIEELEHDAPEVEEINEEPPEEDNENEFQTDEEPEQKTQKKAEEHDEYGNTQEPENEAIRERLARQARKHESEINALRAQLAQQSAAPDVQQAVKDFEYDPESGGDWQQQLREFVKQTVSSMDVEKNTKQQRAEETRLQAEFESKFRDGMNRFDDFREVMTSLPCEITDAMTLATRAMDNPAAFLYAAAKRNPQELERISRIRDPYAQMTEIGKLEERMRKNKPTTKAPRPLGRTPDDSISNAPKKQKEPNGDDLLARADSKRLQNVRARIKANR
jgi:hypothetical protein